MAKRRTTAPETEEQRRRTTCLICGERVMWMYGGPIRFSTQWQGHEVTVVTEQPIHDECIRKIVTVRDPLPAA